jgi:hypothetical protein
LFSTMYYTISIGYNIGEYFGHCTNPPFAN